MLMAWMVSSNATEQTIAFFLLRKLRLVKVIARVRKLGRLRKSPALAKFAENASHLLAGAQSHADHADWNADTGATSIITPHGRRVLDHFQSQCCIP
jgi:hypothetical protein